MSDQNQPPATENRVQSLDVSLRDLIDRIDVVRARIRQSEAERSGLHQLVRSGYITQPPPILPPPFTTATATATAMSFNPFSHSVNFVYALPQTTYHEPTDHTPRTLTYIHTQLSILTYFLTHATDTPVLPSLLTRWTRKLDPTPTHCPTTQDALRLCYYMRSQGFDLYATLDVGKREIKLWYVNAERATRSEESDTCYWRQKWGERVMLTPTRPRRRTAARGELPWQRFRDGEMPMAESMQPRSLSYSDSEAGENEEHAHDILSRLARLGARAAVLRTRTRAPEGNEEDEETIERLLAEHRSRYRADGTHVDDDVEPRTWSALDFPTVSPHGSAQIRRPPRRVEDLPGNAISAVARHERHLSQVAHLNSIPLDRQRELDALLESGADAERVRILIGELEGEGEAGGPVGGEENGGGSRARRWDRGGDGSQGRSGDGDRGEEPTPAVERLLEQIVSADSDEEDGEDVGESGW